MGRAKPTTVAGKYFPTLSALDDYVSRLLSDIGETSDLRAACVGDDNKAESIAFLEAVMERHPHAATLLAHEPRIETKRDIKGTMRVRLHYLCGKCVDYSICSGCVYRRDSDGTFSCSPRFVDPSRPLFTD